MAVIPVADNPGFSLPLSLQDMAWNSGTEELDSADFPPDEVAPCDLSSSHDDPANDNAFDIPSADSSWKMRDVSIPKKAIPDDRGDDLELIARIKAHVSGDRAAWAEMKRRYTGFMHFMANRYRGRGVDHEDLLQAGWIGLLRAIERFEPERGTKLVTYAFDWVRSEMKCLVDDMGGGSVHVPIEVRDAVRKVEEAARCHYQEKGEYPDDALIAERTGFSVAHVARYQEQSASRTFSLDVPQKDNEAWRWSLRISLPAGTRLQDEALSMSQEVFMFLQSLPPNMRRVIELRSGLGDAEREMTLEEIARIVDVTHERVRKIEIEADERLQEAVRKKKSIKPWRAWLMDGAIREAMFTRLSKEERLLFKYSFEEWISEKACAREIKVDVRSIKVMRNRLLAKLDALHQSLAARHQHDRSL